MTSPPTSPPAPPVIAVGLATRLGQVVAAVFALVAAVTAILHGDHSQETVTSMVLCVATVITLMGGRYTQAAVAHFAHSLVVAQKAAEELDAELVSGTRARKRGGGS